MGYFSSEETAKRIKERRAKYAEAQRQRDAQEAYEQLSQAQEQSRNQAPDPYGGNSALFAAGRRTAQSAATQVYNDLGMSSGGVSSEAKDNIIKSRLGTQDANPRFKLYKERPTYTVPDTTDKINARLAEISPKFKEYQSRLAKEIPLSDAEKLDSYKLETEYKALNEKLSDDAREARREKLAAVNDIENPLLRGAGRAGVMALGVAANLARGASNASAVLSDAPTDTKAGAAELAQYDVMRDLKDESAIKGVAADLYVNILRMAPSIAAGGISGSRALASSVFGVPIFGNAYSEAKSGGAGDLGAVAYALINTALEVGLQNVLGGIGALAKNGASPITRALSPTFKKVAVKLVRSPVAQARIGAIGKALGDMASEGIEEYLQDIIDPVVRNLTLGEDNKFKLVTPEALYSGVLGALSAGILNAPAYVQNVRAEVAEKTAQSGAGYIANSDKTVYNNNRGEMNGRKETRAAEGLDYRADRGSESGDRAGMPIGQDGQNPQTGGAVEVNQGRNDTGSVGALHSGIDNVLTPLSEPVASKLLDNGATDLELSSSDKNYEAFSAALQAAIDTNPYGKAVSPKSADELSASGAKTFLSKDGTAGGLVTKDGDVEAIFKTKSSSHKKAADALMLTALANGGVKLDCYGARLASIYSGYGFIPVAKVLYNSGSDPGLPASLNNPDVYVMIHNGDSVDTVANSLGKYAPPDFDGIKTFGKDEYAQALEYRDSLLSNPQSPYFYAGYADPNAKAGGAAPAPANLTADQLRKKSGVIPQGEQLYDEQGNRVTQESNVPKRDINGMAVSRFYRTFEESATSDPTFKQMFDAAFEQGDAGYIEVSDKLAVENAREIVSDNGFDAEYGKVMGLLAAGKYDKFVFAEAQELIVAAKKNGDYARAANLIAELATSGSTAGQAIQALSIMKRLGPEGDYLLLKRAAEKVKKTVGGTDKQIAKKKAKNARKAKAAQDKLDTLEADKVALIKGGVTEHEAEIQLAKIEKTIAELKTQIKSLNFDFSLPQEYIDDILSQTTDEGRAAAVKRATEYLGSIIPSTWHDKWNAWRYLAMLANPRTHVRNILGNAAFIPAREAANIIATGLERFIPAEQRTTAILNPRSASDKALLDYAKTMFNPETVTTSGKYNSSNAIMNARKIFENKALEFLRSKNMGALDKEDVWFMRPAYTRQFAQLMKARGVTADTITNEQIIAFSSKATEAALYATYRDASKTADALSNLSRSLSDSSNPFAKIAGSSLEGVLPFKKTPLNIFKRGIDFSPAGLIQGIVELATAKSTGMSASEAICDFSSGLTGTGLWAAGMLLAKLGLLHGGRDDDEYTDEQEYSITIGDGSYTIDWLAPISLPLFVGVETYNALAKTGSGESALNEIYDSLMRIAEPMVNMSMLQGLSSSIETAKYSPNDALSQIFVNGLINYVTQGIPSLSGAVARTIDPVRRSTTADKTKTGFERNLDKTWRKFAAKVPFLSKTLEPYVDVWGEEDKGGVVESVIENFLSPGYFSNGRFTDADTALAELYAESKENSVVPNLFNGSFSYDGEKYTLSSKELTAFNKTRGQTALPLIQSLTSSPIYGSMETKARSAAVERIYAYATAKAKSEYLSGKGVEYELPAWVEKADENRAGLSASEYMLCMGIAGLFTKGTADAQKRAQYQALTTAGIPSDTAWAFVYIYHH